MQRQPHQLSSNQQERWTLKVATRVFFECLCHSLGPIEPDCTLVLSHVTRSLVGTATADSDTPYWGLLAPGGMVCEAAVQLCFHVVTSLEQRGWQLGNWAHRCMLCALGGWPASLATKGAPAPWCLLLHL